MQFTVKSHRFMIAVLLFQKWINIQKILGGIGKESIKKMIAERNVDKIGLDVALGAKEMLKELRIEHVRCKSAGAATFYVWVCSKLLQIF